MKKLLRVISLSLVFFFGGIAFADEPMMTINAHKGSVESIAFNPKDNIFASSSGNTIKLWDAKNNELIKTLDNGRNVNLLEFSPKGNILATASESYKDTIKLWRVKDGGLLHKINTDTFVLMARRSNDIYSIAFNPKGDTLAVATVGRYSDGVASKISFYNVISGKNEQKIISKGSAIEALKYSPLGDIIIGAQNDKIKFWSTTTGKLLRVLNAHNHLIKSLAITPEGDKLISGSYDNTIKVWDIKTGKLIQSLNADKTYVDKVVIGSMKNIIASSGADDGIKIWDIKSGKLLQTLNSKLPHVNSIAFSPKGNILASGDEDLKLWDMNPYNETLANLVYKSIDKSDYIALYEFTKKFSDKFNVVHEALQTVKSAVSREDNIEAMYHMQGTSYAPLVLAVTERIIELEKNKLANIYKTIVEKNTISGYQWFMRTYPKSEDFGNATKAMYRLIEKENTMAAYRWFSDIFLINTSKESAKASGEVTKIMFAKAKEINNVSSYAAFVRRYPLAKGAVEATERIYSILFAKAKEKNTVKAYNEFVYACPLAPQVKEANKKAYEIEKAKYTDIGMLGFVGKDGKMNKQARKLLIEAKKILDSGISKEEFLTFRNLGYFIVVGRMYELVRSEFGETDAALTLQESENIDKFKKRYQNFIYSLTKETGDWESKAEKSESVVDLVNEVIGDVYTDKQLIDFYNNSGKEAFTKYLNDDKKETEKFLQKREQDERKQKEKRTKEIKEKTTNFEKLYQKVVSEYKPEPVKVESVTILTDAQIKVQKTKEEAKLFKEGCDGGNMEECFKFGNMLRKGKRKRGTGWIKLNFMKYSRLLKIINVINR